jgi:hypothetical protein
VVNDGPLSNEDDVGDDVELSGARLSVAPGDCGKSIGGAAIVEPMLLHSPVGGAFVSKLRSTGVAGIEEPQFDVGGGAGVLEVVGHGGGAGLLRVAALVGGAAGWTANG